MKNIPINLVLHEHEQCYQITGLFICHLAITEVCSHLEEGGKAAGWGKMDKVKAGERIRFQRNLVDFVLIPAPPRAVGRPQLHRGRGCNPWITYILRFLIDKPAHLIINQMHLRQG